MARTKTIRMRKAFLFFVLCFSSLSLIHASGIQEEHLKRYNFSHITLKEGLPHHFVDDIYKDSKGFLWISTLGGGLSRYDAYDFKYYNISTYPVALSSNFIHKVCEDNFNRLWIASEGGVNILNLSTQLLDDSFYKDRTLSELLNKPAYMVMKDSGGNMWLSVENDVYRITLRQDGSIDEIDAVVCDFGPSLGPLTAIREIDNEIWVGYNHHVCAVKKWPGGELFLAEVSSSLIFEKGCFISVFFEKENEVWIGTDRGLFRYNKNNHSLRQYTHDPDEPESLSQGTVTDLAETDDKELLVATLKGLNFYNSTTDHFIRINSDEKGMSNTISSDFINCLLTDGALVWIGTEAGGLNRMNRRKLSVHNYVHDNDLPGSISKNPVNAIFEDGSGDLWVGSVEGGLNRKKRDSDVFIHYTTSEGLSHNSVSALASDHSDRLWIGTWGGGVNVLENRQGKPVFSLITPLANPEFPADFVGALCYDPINRGMWIGTYRGIFFYDIHRQKISNPLPYSVTKNIQGVIGSIVDSDNQLWVGTSGGLIIINLDSFSQNPSDFSYCYIKREKDNPQSLFVEKITFIYESSDGAVWLGTNGYGLYKKDKGTPLNDKFQSFTIENGLPNNCIFGIAEDMDGDIWISTNNGLSCYNIQKNRFTNYTSDDGLNGNQFYWNAAFASKSRGELYFGHLNGMTVIENSPIMYESHPSKVVLTKLNVLNKSIQPYDGKYIDRDISQAHSLHLHERDKSFSLEFSSLDYENAHVVNYAFRLLGFDDEWIKTPFNRRFASYTNLPPGTYTFQVKVDSDEEEASGLTELKIVVSPFFYKTWWFISLMVLACSLAVLRIYHWRINALKKQKELLRLTVEKRTKELEEQKETLENQTYELSRQNEVLKRQNLKITRQKEQLVKLSEEIQELTVDKLAFFTNITHEFRTPITLISGPVERALKLSNNPQVIEQLGFVKRNAKYLLSLVNQLMDFRKAESDKIEIVRTKGNILHYTDEILKPFEVFALERGVYIEKRYRMDTPEILFDHENMNKLMTNLLSNAIKFTPDGGNVCVYMALLSEKTTHEEQLYISVRDSGMGVDEDELDKIFNRFYQSKKNIKYPVYGQSSTGIGLYLCKRIVEIQGGTIYAKNNPTIGASFRVLLPLSGKESGYSETIPMEKNDIVTAKETERITILVVEDNPDMRSYIRSILTERFNVLEAGNGLEALSILNLKPVDFIVSDLMMPVMDGIELSRRVKENFAISHIPFLMLTAKTSVESKIESFKVGVDEYLLKPFDEELLLTRIDNIIGNRKRSKKEFKYEMDLDILNIEEESRDKKFLNKAMEIVKAHFDDSYFEVNDFVETMGISKSLLNKKMHAITGQAPSQFMRNYRLKVAHGLILKNRSGKNMNISEIAYKVGFNDPKYFTRCFTKHFGVTPSSLMEDNG